MLGSGTQKPPNRVMAREAGDSSTWSDKERATGVSNKRSSLHLVEDKKMQEILDPDLRGIHDVAA